MNFPTTAYLELPFLDFAAFNVYLEEQEKLAAYLRRLQNIAGDLPLVLAEIGLDSRRNGQIAQAHSLDWQITHGIPRRLLRRVRLCVDRRVVSRRPADQRIGISV